MNERCVNCGAELFAGQQFCRRCGAPTNASATESTTQLFTQGQGPGAPNATSPLAGGNTNAVYAPQTAHYQPRVAPPQSPAGAPSLVAPGRPARRWLLAFLLIGVLGMVTLVSLLVGLSLRHRSAPEVRVIKFNPPAPPAPPVMPRIVGEHPAADAHAGASGDETVTRKFKLAEGASVVLSQAGGSVSIEGTDDDEAEVTMTKTGGSEADRNAVQLVQQSTEKKLELSTDSPRSSVSVNYEIKLPRTVKQLEISAEMSALKLSNVEADVALKVRRSSLELSGIKGAIDVTAMQSTTALVLGEESAETRAPASIKNLQGTLELRVEDEVNVDIKGEVVAGEASVDEELGLKVEKKEMKQEVAGRLGEGGREIKLNVITGKLTISK